MQTLSRVFSNSREDIASIVGDPDFLPREHLARIFGESNLPLWGHLPPRIDHIRTFRLMLLDWHKFEKSMYIYHRRRGFLFTVIYNAFRDVAFLLMVLYLIYVYDYTPIFGQQEEYSPIVQGMVWCFSIYVTYIALRDFIEEECVGQLMYFWEIRRFYRVVLDITDKDLWRFTWIQVLPRFAFIMQTVLQVFSRDREDIVPVMGVFDSTFPQWAHLPPHVNTFRSMLLHWNLFQESMYIYHRRRGFLLVVKDAVGNLLYNGLVFAIVLYIIYGFDYTLLFGKQEEYSCFLRAFVLYCTICVPIVGLVDLISKVVKCGWHLMYFLKIRRFYNAVLDIDDDDLWRFTWFQVMEKVHAALRVQPGH